MIPGIVVSIVKTILMEKAVKYVAGKAVEIVKNRAHNKLVKAANEGMDEWDRKKNANKIQD